MYISFFAYISDQRYSLDMISLLDLILIYFKPLM